MGPGLSRRLRTADARVSTRSRRRACTLRQRLRRQTRGGRKGGLPLWGEATWSMGIGSASPARIGRSKSSAPEAAMLTKEVVQQTIGHRWSEWPFGALFAWSGQQSIAEAESDAIAISWAMSTWVRSSLAMSSVMLSDLASGAFESITKPADPAVGSKATDRAIVTAMMVRMRRIHRNISYLTARPSSSQLAGSIRPNSDDAARPSEATPAGKENLLPRPCMPNLAPLWVDVWAAGNDSAARARPRRTIPRFLALHP
jgi:hypothetical protein